MVIVNGEAKIVLVNAQAEALFGYPRAEMLDQPVEPQPERLQGEHARHRAAYSEKPTPRTMGPGRELYAIRKDGSEIPVEIILSPIETDEGTLISSAIRDTTERKCVEACSSAPTASSRRSATPSPTISGRPCAP